MRLVNSTHRAGKDRPFSKRTWRQQRLDDNGIADNIFPKRGTNCTNDATNITKIKDMKKQKEKRAQQAIN